MSTTYIFFSGVHMILVLLHFLLGRKNTYRDIKGQVGFGKWRAAIFSCILFTMLLVSILMIILSSLEVSFWDHYEKFESFHSYKTKRFIMLLFFLSLAVTQLFMLFNFIRHMDLKARDCCLMGSGLALTILSLAILVGLIVLLFYPDKQVLYNSFEVALAIVQVLGQIPMLHTIIIK